MFSAVSSMRTVIIFTTKAVKDMHPLFKNQRLHIPLETTIEYIVIHFDVMTLPCNALFVNETDLDDDGSLGYDTYRRNSDDAKEEIMYIFQYLNKMITKRGVAIRVHSEYEEAIFNLSFTTGDVNSVRATGFCSLDRENN